MTLYFLHYIYNNYFIMESSAPIHLLTDLQVYNGWFLIVLYSQTSVMIILLYIWLNF